MTITLDPVTHTYRVDGEIKRSWSQVSREMGLSVEFPEAAFAHVENARARGTQVHAYAADYILRGLPPPYDLVDSTDGQPYVHPETVPYLKAFEDFVLASGVSPTAIERPLYSPELDICCTPDFTTKIGVYDIKHTDKPSRTWGLQLACQAIAHDVLATRAIVWLRPKLKTRRYEVHSSDHSWNRIFTAFDFDVVREACAGIHGPAIKAWKALEGR